MRRSRGALAFWAGTIGTLGLIDYYLDRNYPEYTLSNTNRTWMFCHHPLGVAVFLGTWAGLTRWYLPHIIVPAWGARKAVAAVSRSLAAPKE